MSNLAERARELAERIVYEAPASDICGAPEAIQWHDKLIEQALLAERRLAMEFCAEQLYFRAAELHIENPVRWELFQQSASIRRAAAEKEVGTK